MNLIIKSDLQNTVFIKNPEIFEGVCLIIFFNSILPAKWTTVIVENTLPCYYHILASMHCKGQAHSTDYNGKSPLQIAADIGHLEICHLLCKNGGDLVCDN